MTCHQDSFEKDAVLKKILLVDDDAPFRHLFSVGKLCGELVIGKYKSEEENWGGRICKNIRRYFMPRYAQAVN